MTASCGQVLMTVPIPAWLSHEGTEVNKSKPIDACIADIVAALNAAGIKTAASCCGHGKGPGEIVLHDTRKLSVWPFCPGAGGWR